MALFKLRSSIVLEPDYASLSSSVRFFGGGSITFFKKEAKQVSKAGMGLWELRIWNLLYGFGHGIYTTTSELHSWCLWQHKF